ncbi:MAG: hypothetical protein V4469_01790 [Patescibacteria group bacterium]
MKTPTLIILAAIIGFGIALWTQSNNHNERKPTWKFLLGLCAINVPVAPVVYLILAIIADPL